ncbi:MAG: OsmC family protein, partial [Promethearchaeota archaeon]
EDKPEAGVVKPKVKASTKNGLVILEAGNTAWKEDLPPSLGGNNTTIGPLQHLLGSLAGCAAGLIKNTLAPLTGTFVDSVDAEAQCEFDVKGVHGMKGATGDIEKVSLTLTICSDESSNKIEKMFETWKQRAPVFLCFQKPVQISTNLVIKKPKNK